MDEKWIFILSINININDKLCWNLVEIKKMSPPPRPPPLQSSILMASSQDNGKIGKIIIVFSKDKGMQTQVYKNGAQIQYSSFSLTSSAPNASK